MTDQMNDEQYRKACRYRVQETLEGLAAAWSVPDEQVDGQLIASSLLWLQRALDDLGYFQEKIADGEARQPSAGSMDQWR